MNKKNFVIFAAPRKSMDIPDCCSDPLCNVCNARRAVENKITAHIAKNCNNVPVSEVWDCVQVLIHGLVCFGIDMNHFDLNDVVFYLNDEVNNHPEIISGVDSSVRLN